MFKDKQLVAFTATGLQQMGATQFGVAAKKGILARYTPNTNGYDSYQRVSFAEEVPFDNNIRQIYTFYSTNCIREATPEEIEASKKAVSEYEKELKIKKDEILAKVKIPIPEEAWENRKLDLEERKVINSNMNFTNLGTWDQKKETFAISTPGYGGVCCAFTKTTSDLEIFIPRVWLNHFGYKRIDLVNYLRFLNKCNFGFEYEFVGVMKEYPAMEEHKTRAGYAKTDDEYHFNLTNANTNNGTGNTAANNITMWPAKMRGFYCVRVKGGSETLHTYMKFICVRYIYNHQYWNIPATAMMIKKALGTKVSHMTAFLMAHLRVAYNDYYNLVHSSSQDGLVDVFQDVQETVVKRFALRPQPSPYMNKYWTYNPKLKRGHIAEFFKTNDFKGLLAYLKENK